MVNERPPLEDMTLRQLRRVASEYQVSRYSRLRKSELLRSIQDAERASQLQATTAPSAPSMSAPIDAPVTAPMPTATPASAAASVSMSGQISGQISGQSLSQNLSSQSSSMVPEESQETVEAAKFDVGQNRPKEIVLSDVDADLPELPDGYSDSRIVLMPRDPQWSYVYWDVPNEHKDELRRQGGNQLALRLYDVTEIDINLRAPHSMQEYPCDEMAREWYLPIPVSDRTYIVELGYCAMDGRWLTLVRSPRVHVPPVYPSEWIEDHFITVNWEEELRGRTVFELKPPSLVAAEAAVEGIHATVFGQGKEAEALRLAGSLFGSMQQDTLGGSEVPGSAQMIESVSSFVFPSGLGMWAAELPGAPGVFPTNFSGMGLTMSGAGIGASMPPLRNIGPRKFWLIADAELIVYGATEPDATVTIGGKPIKLNSDGTFRFQMSFQDGLIDYPIMAVAADGEQTRSIHMKFERETPSRHTNTKEEALEEWLA